MQVWSSCRFISITNILLFVLLILNLQKITFSSENTILSDVILQLLQWPRIV